MFAYCRFIGCNFDYKNCSITRQKLFKKNTLANFFAISFVTYPKRMQMPRERTFPTPAPTGNIPREHRFYAQLIPWLQPLFSQISVDKLQVLNEAS